jgi:hypothetical protein
MRLWRLPIAVASCSAFCVFDIVRAQARVARAASQQSEPELSEVQETLSTKGA